jgi:hypothetical protein
MDNKHREIGFDECSSKVEIKSTVVRKIDLLTFNPILC